MQNAIEVRYISDRIEMLFLSFNDKSPLSSFQIINSFIVDTEQTTSQLLLDKVTNARDSSTTTKTKT